MNRLRVIGADIGPEECIFEVEISTENDEVLGTARGERNARLFSEAHEMYELVKQMDCEEAKSIVERIEHSPELTADGLTAKEIAECTI